LIGAKSLAALVLAALAALVAHNTGLTHPERLLALDATTAFFIGLFAAVAGTLLFRFWRAGDPSNHYFRLRRGGRSWEDEAHFLGSERLHIAVGVNGARDAWDLSPGMRHAIWVAMTFVLAWATLDARALAHLAGVPERLSVAGSEFCPDPSEKKVDVKRADEPGCALVRRAYEMGYAKTLGSCAPKQQVEEAKLCTLRQRDEPFLHYGWRRLAGFVGAVRHYTDPEEVERLRQETESRADSLRPLLAAQREILASSPRAAHHIWTNLPEPAGFEPDRCLDAWRMLPHRPPAGADNSQVFTHVLAQLLFETRYEPAVGLCREYYIHWNAPPDACDTLAATPEAFLEQSDALASVERVLERYHGEIEVEALEAKIAGKPETTKEIPPARFVTFSCYVEELRPDVWRSNEPVQLLGYDFAAEELRAPALGSDGSGLHVDRYGHVAALLARGFHFGGLLSEAAIDAQPAEEAAAQAFSGRDFYFTRLHSLANLDVFLDHAWVAARTDLLDVYPYHLHLRNYVSTFRKQYRGERGRL
jgi:hypothetical protein